MRSLLRGISIGLVAATTLILVAGCEAPPMAAPIASKDPTAPTAPPTSTAQYRAADLDELGERWAVLPTLSGPAAVADSQSQLRRASATDGFSGFPAYFTFSDANDYGACVTFTANITYPDSPDSPGIQHVVDCVGDSGEGTTVGGLFHTAHWCSGEYSGFIGALEYRLFWGIIIRAGDFQPEMGPHPAADPSEGGRSDYVHISIQEQPGGTVIEAHLRWRHHFPGHPEIPTNHASYGGYVVEEFDNLMYGFGDIDRESEQLHWSVDHSRGVAEIGEHDWGAVDDYRERCASIGIER